MINFKHIHRGCQYFREAASLCLLHTSNKVGSRAVRASYTTTATTEHESEEAVHDLTSLLGNTRVATSEVARQQHDHDESYHQDRSPAVVVWPNSVEEVSEIAKICTKYTCPMIPFGTGTGLEGGVVPLRKQTVCVNLLNLDKISELRVDDFCIDVQPGVTRKQLNYDIRDTGLWFPVDPGADASLCGMASTGASGTNAVRYGTMKENVLNLEVVLSDGTVVHTAGKGQHCRKRSAGYNLTELFVGSEGTLGLITSATLKLHSIPETVVSAVCSFPTISQAVDTVIQILQYAIPVARMELLDANTITAVNSYSKRNYDPQPSLFFEFHGSANSTEDQIDMVKDIVRSNDGSEMRWAENTEDRNRLWQARHDVLYAALSLKPGSKALSTDVCVPISKLPEAIDYTVERCENLGIFNTVVGHVGDGNFHCLMAIDPNDEEECKRAKQAAHDMALKAIKLGGTCTGEHGVGIGKKSLLQTELGFEGISTMKKIKHALDPLNLMNPDKVLD